MADNAFNRPRNALMDTAQGVSKGFWADGLGGPVDLMTTLANLGIAGGGYAGHKLGLLSQPPSLIQNPTGGSEWIAQQMRQRGLLNDNPGSTADNYGRVAGGLLAPLTQARAPQIANALNQAPAAIQRGAYAVGEKAAGMAENHLVRQGAIQPATVWHGSPHKFDKVNVVSESVNDMGLLGNVPTVRHGAFFSDNPKFASEYGDITKWDVKPKKTAKITQELKDAFVESIDAFGADRDLWLKAKYGSKQDWSLFEGDLGKRFSDWLKSSGYDAAKFKEYVPTASGGEVGGNTTVILNPDTARLLERLGPR